MENKERGESLKYDPTFKGPLSKRSCTDVICLLLFVVVIAAWIAVGIYAFTHGDPVRLLTPTDSTGLRCGLDAKVKNKPYLFFFDLSKCASQTAIMNGCPTPQVCVKECPTEYFSFYYAMETNDINWRSKMICKDGLTAQDKKMAETLIKNNSCAGYYLRSKPVYGRCLPGDIENQFEELQEKLNITAEDLEHVVIGQTHVNILADAKEMSQMIVQDLSESWPFIVGGLCLAMLLCLIYIVLMRWFAGIMVWFSLFGVIALLAFSCYACFVRYDEMKEAEQKAESEPQPEPETKISIEQLDRILAMKDTWLAFLIISAFSLVIILLILVFLRTRILIAIALIKEASKAVGSIMSTLVFPLFPWFMQVIVIAWFVLVMLYLAGTTRPVYKAHMDDCKCTVSNYTYTTGSVCDPDSFQDCVSSCPNAVCQFFNNEMKEYVNYLHAFNIFSSLWSLFFISAFGEMVLAATFATWYWTFNKSDVPFFTITVSMMRTVRYHLGTIAFGSLILTICRIIRLVLEYLQQKLKKYDNAFVKAVMCCLRCFFWCLEKFIRFINRNAYIMCAVHGKNFCMSARDAFGLLMRNVVRVVVLDKVTDFLLFLGKLMITAGMCTLSFYVFSRKIEYEVVTVPHLNYTIVPVLIVGFGTYFIACIFFGVYAMAVDTLFLCFLEDCARTNGVPGGPILHVQKSC